MRRRLLFVMGLVFCLLRAEGQNTIADSLSKLRQGVALAKEDTSKVRMLGTLSQGYQFANADTALIYAQDELQLAQKLGFKKGQAYSMNDMAQAMNTLGDYNAALSWIYKSMPLFQSLDDTLGLIGTNVTASLIYRDEGDYKKALTRDYQALRLATAIKRPDMITVAFGLMSSIYERNGQLDSALFFARQVKEQDLWSGVLTVLGNTYAKLGQDSIAINYYRMAIPKAFRDYFLVDIVDAYSGIALVYNSEGKSDSAIYYARKAMDKQWAKTYPLGVLNATRLLADLYESRHQTDSTLKYLRLTIALKDNLFNQQKIKQAQNFEFNDQFRQQELKAQQRENAANLKFYALMAIAGVILLIAGFLFRNNRLRKKAYSLLRRQKDEIDAQRKNAEIETGLERVRSRAMAMKSSDELAALVATVIAELTRLDVALSWCLITILDEASRSCRVWRANTQTDRLPESYFLPFADYPFQNAIMQAWKERREKWVYELKGEEKKAIDEYMFTRTDYQRLPQKVQDGIRSLDPAWFSFSFGAFGGLQVGGPAPLSDASLDILSRFGKVFDLTYTRFNDLLLAEAQAREGQIEAALERVRSKTMAMRSSKEMIDTVRTLFEELTKLGVTKSVRSGIAIVNDTNQMEAWSARTGPDGNIAFNTGYLDLTSHQLFQKFHEAFKNKEADFCYKLAGEDMMVYYRAINAMSGYTGQFNLSALPPEEWHYSFFFADGAIFIFSPLPLTTEATKIYQRFSAVFDLTYRRFLDLQKAEAQAREGQIEAALERVRGKAIAMHSSADLTATAKLVFFELRRLGIDLMRSGIGLIDESTRSVALHTATNRENTTDLELLGTAVLSHHPVLMEIFDHWLVKEEYFPVLEGELLLSYNQRLRDTGFPVPDWHNVGPVYGYFFPFTEGELYCWSDKPLSNADIDTIRRFTAVIGLTYRRYFELQQAEANSREATRQASLDRVRAEIASMRTPADLDKITPLIWNELTILGVPFFRCGVFLMNEVQRSIHCYLSTPDGKAIAAFPMSFDTEGIGRPMLKNWREKRIYTDHWDQEEFRAFSVSLVRQGAIGSEGSYITELPPAGLYLHFFPFLQGMLYVGSSAPLAENEISLAQSLADTFATAYARYDDFTRLEAAKQVVDRTLTELKATQSQLIQAEKMASLGELTAGIAHEIQNPLNFVNNFSELNTELIEEMNAELDKGAIDEAKAIACDLKQNMEKINLHGKRADSIVKNMLQHSRKSSGQKELTDINALADEYLRLSYHGLRAKNKDFNARLETRLEEDLPKLAVVAQDIGRVLLNLFTNAFYSVMQKSKMGGEAYRPLVELVTAKTDKGIEIRVKDNGLGIPAQVQEKIFNPFFTTKPVGDGTGLGLSLSYDIITKGHGGAIEVLTEEGGFAEFIIQLPKI